MFYKDKKILTLLNTYDHLAHNDQDPFFAYFMSLHSKLSALFTRYVTRITKVLINK